MGGKGANLGEMVRARLPVPPGFCITTIAYTRVAAQAQIESLAVELAQMPARSIERLAAQASRIRDLIEATPIPADIADTITAAYRQLGDGVPVAVRSSATAEDLPGAAFAGQQDTYLNVVGAVALLDAVRRCWASLWTDRATAYRERQEIDQRTVKIAVIVQRMVPAEVAGVLFTIFAEMFPVRPYPLDQTTWVHAISAAAVEPIFGLIGIAVPSIEQMFIEEDGVVVRFSGKVVVPPTPAILLAPIRLLRLARRYDPTHWSTDPLLAEARSRARALEMQDLGTLSWQDLLATVRDALALAQPLAGEMRRRYLPRALLAAGLLRVALALLRRGHRFGTLLSGVESTTLEANRALEALAARVRPDPTLAETFARREAGELWTALEQQPSSRAFLSELQAFLGRYGHREVVLSTVLQPTWKDAPELALGIIKGLALTEPRHETERPAWEVARDNVLAHPVLRFSPLRAAILTLLAAARSLWQIRENTHYDATRILPILRRTLLELGRRLVTVDVIDAPEDVFHLKLDELEGIGGTWPSAPERADELRAILLRRKERRAALEGTPLVDPRLYRQREPSSDALLRGTSGSPGVAEGPVRVIRDGSEFGKLRAGEVLVAPYTNPAWTPLFQRAAAVVVDSGGAGSHAAIVAREYGIPAVMGTIDGTQRLADGQHVRVDGDHGRVTLLD
ncbi:MAG TPA: PEP/pyruvate-binding domain-containing protein [Anaerolineae bacterium]|nr:PEP/pyruvate-binding domain-containing protein [Anaerolineae bacterium]